MIYESALEVSMELGKEKGIPQTDKKKRRTGVNS